MTWNTNVQSTLSEVLLKFSLRKVDSWSDALAHCNDSCVRRILSMMNRSGGKVVWSMSITSINNSWSRLCKSFSRDLVNGVEDHDRPLGGRFQTIPFLKQKHDKSPRESFWELVMCQRFIHHLVKSMPIKLVSSRNLAVSPYGPRLSPFASA